MKRLLALLFYLAVIPWNVPQVRADDGDIFGANIQPNIMIFIDTSDSMADLTLTSPVVAATTSQQLPSKPVPPPSSMRRVLYWRETV